MTEALETLTLGPGEEARRLWKGAEESREHAAEHFASLCEALDLGVRATLILAVSRLQPVRQEYPGSIAMLLESPAPKVDPIRDAINTPRSLSFLDVLDMLSADELACVSPKLHHGWEDRRCSCIRSRMLAREATGVTLDGEERDSLLLLMAYRNRIFLVPPPVTIVLAEIIAAFPALKRLFERLSTPVA